MNIKKLLAMLLALVMVFTLAACGGDDAEEDTTPVEDDTTEDEEGEDTPPVEEEEEEEETEEGTSGTINVVSREDGSGTRSAFVEIVGVIDEDDNDLTTQDAAIQASTDEVLTYVSGDANAIGYISLGSLNDDVKALNVDGVEATAENVNAGTYPIQRPFNIAYKEAELSDVAQDFIDYIFSAEGQAVIGPEGYIPVDDAAPAYEATEGLSGNIVVGGSTSVTPLMEVIAEDYMALNPDVTITVEGNGSSQGMTSAMEGTVDIGMASRELKDEEAEALDQQAIAKDGIAVVVSPDNTFEDISLDSLKSIYLGDITTWEEVQ